MLDKITKNGLYKTVDARPKDDRGPITSFTETANLLAKSTAKYNAGSSSSRKNLQSTQKLKLTNNTNKDKTDNPAWHLSTFSSPESLSSIKEKQAQNMHEAMLRSELAKFRTEVEEKFRNSPTNRDFIFPRQTDEKVEDSPDKNFPEENLKSKADCIFLNFPHLSRSHSTTCKHNKWNIKIKCDATKR